jgi:sugar lactone lactonase YvrE
MANLGEDQYIQSLDVDHSGVLLLVSRGAIRRFDTADGRELEPFPNPQASYYEDLSVAPDGRIAVIANSEDVLVYDTRYNLVLSVPQAVSSVTADSELDSDIAIDGLGNLYVLGHFNGSVFQYNPQGVFTNRISSEGEEDGQLSAPGDLAVDGQGRLYISDINGVKIFSSDGRYLDKFDLSGYVAGLNFDTQDRLFTISNEPRLMRLSLRK